MKKNEAFSRVLIDAMLSAQGWDVTNPNAVRFEVVMPDNTRADYVLCDRNGRSLAVIEAKRYSVNPADAAEQAKGYAKQLDVPYVFLTNGSEVLFWEWQQEAYPHPVKTFFKQDDLERRFASLTLRKDVLNVAIDIKIAGRDYQQDCIQTLSREMKQGRRKLLVEMATGTGKTRTAAALIKRLFEANAITRVLFLVDRIPLAKQTEDAFAEHLPDYPAYVLRAGRRFQDEKRITITTLQSMINIYGDYSSGYFDLIISDECHRSIYGKWSGSPSPELFSKRRASQLHVAQQHRRRGMPHNRRNLRIGEPRPLEKSRDGLVPQVMKLEVMQAGSHHHATPPALECIRVLPREQTPLEEVLLVLVLMLPPFVKASRRE